ncbi:hypothetical protein A2U01_0003487 [Trifolium medium]|uniref:Uncharacterized protein n=1 Tax=Trifolium medium TaxID=97028 RepID=A0A392M5R3_9FABA|nr:hypothetical protein [Trifolium medium]
MVRGFLTVDWGFFFLELLRGILFDTEGEDSLTFVYFSFFTADLDFFFFDSCACTVVIEVASAMIAPASSFDFERVALLFDGVTVI